MATHVVNIGTPVRTSDGKHLGDVQRLIIDTETNRLAYLTVDEGFLAGERLIDAGMIALAGEDGVVLSVAADEAEQLPTYVEREFVQTRGDVDVATPTYAATTIPVADSGGRWSVIDSRTAGYPNITGPSVFTQPPLGRVVTQTVSNVPDRDVAISEGTDVKGSDGEKIGSVDELLFDDQNQIAGFVVKAGFLFKHDVRIPIDWVEGIAHDHVRLNVTKDQAERARHG